jgi:transcriptional regulator with XRE-family HTH domain
VGYRGKLKEQTKARDLRAKGLTMDEIAMKLAVSKSSVSLWTRDVPFQPRLLKTKARRRAPNALQRRKQEEIDRLRAEGIERIGQLTEKEFLVAGAAIYACEGGKTQAQVGFSNSDPRLVAFFCAWLRKFFDPDESRLRVRLYLHRGLDLQAAMALWSEVAAIPTSQFTAPYRADPDPTIRRAKHPYGCATVVYCCSRTHRAVMGLVDALLTSNAIPG